MCVRVRVRVCVLCVVCLNPNLDFYTTQAFELRQMRNQHQKQLSLIFFLEVTKVFKYCPGVRAGEDAQPAPNAAVQRR